MPAVRLIAAATLKPRALGGTRVPVGVLFEKLADGSTLDDWQTLRREQLVEALLEAMEIMTEAVSTEDSSAGEMVGNPV